MQKITCKIAGMHCKACELLLEEKIVQVVGVTKVQLNHKTGLVEIFYAELNTQPDKAKLRAVIEAAGYTLAKTDSAKPQGLFSSDPQVYFDLGRVLLILFMLYVLAKATGLANLNFAMPSEPQGLGVVVLVGLVAGFSTCMALLGGLVLGFSTQQATVSPESKSSFQVLKPHLLFNLGRLSGYFMLGGILGYFGSLLSFSPPVLGAITVAVGLVMLLLGLKLTGISPLLANQTVALPASVGRWLGLNRQDSKHGPLLLGALTFFLPCSFTQAMQLYALSSGGFFKGGLIMAAFALGTLPGLLGIGSLAGFFRQQKSRLWFRLAGVLVVLLAGFNLSNGLNLGGWKQSVTSDVATPVSSKQSVNPSVSLEDGVQVVRMTQKAGGYVPNKFTIKKDLPVRWVIKSEAQTCASSIVLAKYKINRQLRPGENVIEFTPTESGKLPFSCAMGMYSGLFIVE